MKRYLLAFFLLSALSVLAQKDPKRPHSVELNWKAPNIPVSYYEVFRSNKEKDCDTGKPYAERVQEPHFVDRKVEAGKTYYYCVVSVRSDIKGTQKSAPSAKIKATVPKP